MGSDMKTCGQTTRVPGLLVPIRTYVAVALYRVHDRYPGSELIWRLLCWIAPLGKYRNPDPRCTYPFEPTVIGYCWGYANRIDGNMAKGCWDECKGCDSYQQEAPDA